MRNRTCRAAASTSILALVLGLAPGPARAEEEPGAPNPAAVPQTGVLGDALRRPGGLPPLDVPLLAETDPGKSGGRWSRMSRGKKIGIVVGIVAGAVLLAAVAGGGGGYGGGNGGDGGYVPPGN